MSANETRINDIAVVSMPSFIFPVNTDQNDTFAGTLLVREATEDIWKIFETEVLNGLMGGMIVMGPTGVGQVSK